MKLLAGLTALVTGSSSGIGAAIARHLAQAGARVVVNYFRNERGAKETARRVRKAGARAMVIRADVGVSADVDRMFAEIDAEFGRLDILVNNAGVTLKTPLLDTTEEDFDACLRTNLKSVFLCSQQAARRMVKSGGAILNISSIHAATTVHNFGAYAASKGGIESLTRSVAIEWGHLGIRVNALRVGVVSVERDRIAPDHPLYEAVCRRIPVGRPGNVDDVGSLAVFLCSPKATFISGAVIAVDGGAGAMMNAPFDKGFARDGVLDRRRCSSRKEDS